MEEIIIEIKDLSFDVFIFYKDFKIHKNKVTFIVGQSGSGKSTLLKLLNATISPSSGTIFYDSTDITFLDTITLRQEISLIGQNVFLFDMNIKENFYEFYKYRTQVPPSEDEMIQFLKICCIDFDLNKDCTTMSGGERQRVYMAIYLSFMPKVLMLDEPTSALDSKNSNEVIANILSFCRKNNITVIVVSHDQALTNEFAEEIICVEKDS